jgi:hypothetical protein
MLKRFRTPHCFICGYGIYRSPIKGMVGRIIQRINHELPEHASSTVATIALVDGYAWERTKDGWYSENLIETRVARGYAGYK